VLVTAQFWAFANDLYDSESGKRIFPIIGIGSSLGAWIGARLWRVIERPSARSVAWAVPVLGFVVPFLMGIGDLFLRWGVP